MNKISLFLSLSLVAACGNPAKEAQNKVEEKGLDLSAMDTLVRPQDDFYNYVNGGWMKTAKIPADKTSWGSLRQGFYLSIGGENKDLIGIEIHFKLLDKLYRVGFTVFQDFL